MTSKKGNKLYTNAHSALKLKTPTLGRGFLLSLYLVYRMEGNSCAKAKLLVYSELLGIGA
jgi:hypothetical protein